MSSRFVVLRPEPGASATADHIRAMGRQALTVPLFHAVPQSWDGPDPAGIDAVMFTSANGARLAGPELARYRHLPAYAVGEATAGAVRASGFLRVEAGNTDATALAKHMALAGHCTILHMAGRDVRPFDAAGLQIARRIVYAMDPTQDGAMLPDRLESGDCLLVHSPRAGARLAALIPRLARKRFHLAAISPAALQACDEGWQKASAASQPTDTALLALAAGLCD